MQWLIIGLVIFTILLAGASIVIGGDVMQLEVESENTQGFLSNVGLDSNATLTHFCKPDAEITCYDTTCTYELGEKRFVDRECNTLTDVGNFYYENGEFIVEFNGTTSYIKPYIYALGQKKYLSEVPFQTIHNISEKRFSWKYGFGGNGIVTTIDMVGFEINGSADLDFIFADLEATNFVVNDSNPNDIIITNVSNNIIDGSLFLDPEVTLNSGNNTAYVFTTSSSNPGRYGFQTKWDIEFLPNGATINSATNCYYGEDPSVIGNTPPNSTINLSRVDDQTWDNSISASTYNVQNITNITTTSVWNSSSFGTNWCTNVTEMLKYDYDMLNQFTSFRFETLDYPTVFPISSLTQGPGDMRYGITQRGNNHYINMQSPAGSPKPFLIVNTTAEFDSPNVTLRFPTNNSNITAQTQTSGSQFNFTCQVEDASEIDNVQLWSDFRNGTWMLESTNTTNLTSGNFTFYQNLTNWYNGKVVCNPDEWVPSGSGAYFNGSDYWVVDKSDKKIYHLNSSCGHINNVSFAMLFVLGAGGNTTHLVISDGLQKRLYFYDKDTLAHQHNCSLAGLSAGIVPTGIDIHNDGTIYVASDETGKEKIYHTNSACANLGSINIFTSAPAYLTVINDSFILMAGTSGNYEVHYLNGSSIYNNTFYYVTNDSTGPYGMLSIDKSQDMNTNWRDLERLYFGHSSGENDYKFAGRYLNNTVPNWNCIAEDTYGNLGTATNNWTFHVRNITVTPSDCWTYENNLLTIPTGCLFTGSELGELFEI